VPLKKRCQLPTCHKKVWRHLHAMSLTLVYPCAIPSTLRANGVKPSTEMTIFPCGSHQSLPPLFSFFPPLSLPEPAPAPRPSHSSSEAEPWRRTRAAEPRLYRYFPRAPQAGSLGAPARDSSAARSRRGRALAQGSPAAAGCRSMAASSRPSRCGFGENAMCHGHGREVEG
jgi:hypothetical protein